MRWNGWNEDVKKDVEEFFLNLPLSDPTTGESDEEVDEKIITQREKTTKHMLLYFA